MKKAVAGIDIGGTKIAIALETVQGERISSRQFSTRVADGPQLILNHLASVIRQMCAASDAGLLAVGIGCPGSVDKERGLVLSPINLPGWHEFPLVQSIEDGLCVPVLIENDAKLAALGEYAHGAGRGFSDIVFLTISTGIGGGIIVNGEIIQRLGAGEVGHMTVAPDGPLCGCGCRGCLDALCSGTAIARRARALMAKGEASIISEMVNHADDITAQIVAAAAQSGDELARRVWDEMIYFLSLGIGNVITILAPEAVIIGGGVAASGEQLFGPLRPLVERRAKMIPVESVQLLQGALGGESGVYGALAIARQVAARQTSGA
ncbi:MAG TPA: ROK family protein [Pyrinomonadaceae bacterium]|nr:ROK family protein [Pyrinomonadaceae bacterium]